MKKPISAVSKLEDLTNQELEVLRWIATGASDNEIAQALFLSVNTIKWHNRNIYAKLGVQSRTQAVYEAGRRGLLDQISLTKWQDQDRSLPAEVSSFVGREIELPRIQEALQSTRLLTLTGPGGVGKTRLALAVSRACQSGKDYQHGVYWVDLAPHNRPDWVADVIAENLGLSPGVGCSSPELLRESLQDKELLLVIDNFEHLLPAAPLIHDLLANSPHLNVLVTSREALKLSGERTYPVPALDLPELDARDDSTLNGTEAIRLFIERAGGVNREFSPVGEDLKRVGKICARLDGLPLAIELAAAQIKYFSPKEILKQLDDRFTLLADAPRDVPPRHQSLESAIDWSYQGLTPDQMTLFNRLSVFQGGRTIPAVETICCGDLELDVLDGLRSLRDKHLIQSETGPDGEPRFTLLETLHDYGRLQLVASEEAEEFELRHATYFSNLAADAKYPLRGGPQQTRWLKRIRTEQDNLRTAFAWSMANGQYTLGLRIVAGLGFYWMRDFLFKEGQRWVEQSLEVIDQVGLEIQAGVYLSAGICAFFQGENEYADQLTDKIIEINQALEDQQELGWIYALSMNMAIGDLEKDDLLNQRYSDAMDLFKEIDDKVGMSVANMLIAVHQAELGHLVAAKKHLGQSQSIAVELQDGVRQIMNLLNLGCILIDEEKFQLSQDVMLDSLRQELKLGTRLEWASGTLFNLARTALHLGDPIRGVILLAGSYQMFESTAVLNHPDYQEKDFQEIKELALKDLDPETYQDAWRTGLALSPEQVIEFAFEEYDPDADLSQAWE